jgi:hypothetical protein
MRVDSKAMTIAVFCVAIGLAGSAQAKTVNYPAKGKASFTVVVPDTWKVTDAKDVGDYTDLESAAGTVMQLRTIDAASETLAEVGKEVDDYLAAHYNEVKMTLEGEGCKINGLTCAIAYGTGKEKDGGAEVRLMSAGLALPDGKVGEIWYVAPVADKAGIADATKILGSYKAP